MTKELIEILDSYSNGEYLCTLQGYCCKYLFKITRKEEA
jgi:hypothetical protein